MKITERTFKDFALVLKRSFKSLQELSFILHNPTIPGSALEFVASALTHLTCLKKLRIPCLTIQISQETDGSSFISSIKNLKSLKMLDLDFSSLPKNMITLQILATSLKSWTDPRCLFLNFQDADAFSVQEMEILAQSFQSFPFLENLALDFRDCPCMNDQALEKLSASLGVFTRLSKIALSFDQCPLVGDAGVESLVSQFLSLTNLKSITLSVLNCRPIKNEHNNRLQMNKMIKKSPFSMKGFKLLLILRKGNDSAF